MAQTRFDSYCDIVVETLNFNNSAVLVISSNKYTANHVCVSECPAALYDNGGFTWETGNGTCRLATADGNKATCNEIIYFGIPIN